MMVTGDNFALWLLCTVERETGKTVVFQTRPGATLAPGWYKHRFAPNTECMTRLGPFKTQQEAIDAPGEGVTVHPE